MQSLGQKCACDVVGLTDLHVSKKLLPLMLPLVLCAFHQSCVPGPLQPLAGIEPFQGDL